MIILRDRPSTVFRGPDKNKILDNRNFYPTTTIFQLTDDKLCWKKVFYSKLF